MTSGAMDQGLVGGRDRAGSHGSGHQITQGSGPGHGCHRLQPRLSESPGATRSAGWEGRALVCSAGGKKAGWNIQSPSGSHTSMWMRFSTTAPVMPTCCFWAVHPLSVASAFVAARGSAGGDCGFGRIHRGQSGGIGGSLARTTDSQANQSRTMTPGTLKCFATDSVEKFRRLGAKFLGSSLESVELVDIEK